LNTEYVFCGIHRTEAQCTMGLGFDLGMRCFNYRAAGPEYVDRSRLALRTLREDSAGAEEILIGAEHTACFGLARLTVQGRVPDQDRGRCYVGIVVAGQGRLSGSECDVPLQAGDTFFVPAASAHVTYETTADRPLQVVKCFPPGP